MVHSAGASEVIGLKVTDVDGERMTLGSEQGEGRREPAFLGGYRHFQPGHVLRCEACGADQVSYNSCGNRHGPSARAPLRSVAAKVSGAQQMAR